MLPLHDEWHQFRTREGCSGSRGERTAEGIIQGSRERIAEFARCHQTHPMRTEGWASIRERARIHIGQHVNGGNLLDIANAVQSRVRHTVREVGYLEAVVAEPS